MRALPIRAAARRSAGGTERAMNFGLWEILIILLLGVIIFGAGKLPNAMGDLGKGIRSLKASLDGSSDQSATKPPAAPDDRAPPAA